MARTILLVSAILLFVSSSMGHMCLLNPHQRGSMDGIDKKGATDCALVNPSPCGGRNAEAPVLFAKAGTNFTVVFQKNLDHWNSAAPGNFTVRLSEDVNGQLAEVAVVPDTNAPSLTYYVAEFTLPKREFKHGVLQVVYYPNNPDAPSAFYQCADFGIMPI